MYSPLLLIIKLIKSIFCHTQNQQLLTNSCQYERYKGYGPLLSLQITIGDYKECETVKGKISNNDQVMQEI